MSEGVNLSPEAILQAATETEAQVWVQAGATNEREESFQFNQSDVGFNILQHGNSRKQIHEYFMRFEQRKCCLLLAACKQRFANVRLVRNDGRDSGIEEGAMGKADLAQNESVIGLDAVEFQVFKNALKCAAFPVLGAPEPPSGVTPIPAPSHTHIGGLKGIMAKRKETSLSLQHVTSLSPLSMHDSGVEDQEQEDSALVPTETLCELLRRAFRLTQEKFNHYEKIVIAHIDKKSPQKVLAEELVQQLIALENNQNPFYSPKTFLNRIGYDQWQKKERQHISDLLSKFWHFGLPTPADKTAKMQSLHGQYCKLMEKLISYESPYRQVSELIAPPPTSPLSIASVRLLKEFGLRYGVGDQYCKIVYLHYLALNFDPTVWFIHHISQSLTVVMETMPRDRSCLVIIQEEFTMLKESLNLLEVKSSTAIAKMKTLFSNIGSRPLDGVEPLVELLSLTLQAKSYLLSSPAANLGPILFKIAYSIFPTTYERHKMVSQDELRHNKWNTDLSPKLLNMLIGHIRDEVQDYKNNYQQAFEKYFDITVEAAQEFYHLLIADVVELVKHTTKTQTGGLEINRLMLSLAYRLNQLDQDWRHYIPPRMQSWRQLFMSEAEQWSFVLQQNTQVFVMNAVSIDRYKKCDFPWTGSLHSPSQQAQRQGTISKSLTPSFNSAFTNPSSAKSTPQWLPGSRSHQQDSTGFSGPSSPGPDPSQAPDFPIITPSDDSMSPFMNTSSRRPSSDPVNMSNSSMLNGSYLGNVARSFGHYDEKNLLSFAQLRHSSSLPNLSDRDKFHELMPMPVSESEKREASNFNRSRSSLDAVTFDHDDSDTITDKSDSPIGDFSFPPVEEVLSESSSAVATESHPVVAVSDFAGQGSLLRPSPQKGGVVSERVDISAGQGKSAFSVLKQSPKVENQNESIGIPRQETLHRSRYHERHSENSDENQKQEYGGYDSFTNSLTSNISFPNPLQESQEATMATLPISSGAMDVVTILQRVVGFGRVMCQTLMPSQAQYESDQSGNTSLSDQPMLDIFGKQRQKLYENFLKCVRGTVCQFADNMLCMDLCGSTHSMARRLAGSSLVQYLQTQQSSRLIWGCRHDLATSRHCFEYLDRNTRLLCDRHEPITREMCMRINNVTFMLTCLNWFYHRLRNNFLVSSDLSARQTRDSLQASMNSADNQRSDFLVIDQYGYNPSLDRLEVMETASQLAPSLLSHGEDEHGILVTSPIDGDRDHLMAIIRALCRIMAYRLNLFVMDALPVLLTLKSSEVTIETGLSPLTEFLANYVHTLRSWLYEENFTRVLECLWIFIVQDFEAELRKLEQEDQDGLGHAQLLLQALSHLLKFMNNQHKSLHRDLLLSQADDVSFKLSLYAMPVERLVALYRGLCQDALGSDSSSTSTMYHSVLMVRQRLKHDLQRYKKDFSGADLVKWILKNLELFENLDPGLTEGEVVYKRERAHQIAQRLLDWDIIADVEADTGDQNDSSAYSFDAEFPVVTVHAQLPAKREEGITSDEDNTPEATPRATPKPAGPSGLRQSMRAFSRQSGLKSITPGLRVSQSQRAVGAAELDQSQGKQAVRQTYYAGQRSADKSGLEEAKASTQETLTSRMGKIENTLLTNGANYDDNIAGAGAQNNSNIKTSSDADESSNIVRENTNQDSLVDSIDSLETADARYANNRGMGSPYSYDSTMSVDSNNTIFFDSGSSFYYVKPFVDNFFDIKQHGAWKNNELFSLVEECFQKKVSAQYVMRIIYTRRRNDPRVKKFLQSASSEMIERMSFRARNEEASVCVSS